jgi:hypothetical protein
VRLDLCPGHIFVKLHHLLTRERRREGQDSSKSKQ